MIQLDPYQQAVHDDLVDPENTHNVRVVACAGAGKTRVVIEAVASILEANRPALPAQDIVLTTFTAKAADELRTRLARRMGWSRVSATDPRVPTIGTFHSIALRTLRKNATAHQHGWAMNRCIDVADARSKAPPAWRIWSDILGWGKILGSNEMGLDLGQEVEWRDYATAVDVLASKGLTPDSDDASAEADRSTLRGLFSAWTRYGKVKAALDVWDFADALTAFLDLPEADMPCPRLVVIDEAHDNSLVQLKIGQRLARAGRLVLVNDQAQSIYAFRGAFPEFTANVGAYVPNVKTLALPRNYRSGRAIVALGNAIAAGTSWAHETPAESGRDLDGVVELRDLVLTQHEAADRTAVEIKAQVDAGVKPEEFCVLVRTNALAGLYELSLVSKQVPVAVVGRSFFQSVPVQSILAYCLLAIGDYPNALDTIVNRPNRYLSRSMLASVRDLVHAQHRSIPQAIREAASELRPQAADRARDLAALIERLRVLGWPGPATEAAGLLAGDAQKRAQGRGTLREGDDDAGKVYQTIAEIAQRFNNAADLLAYVDHCQRNTVSSDDRIAGRVTVSTAHRGKGLEWPIVYLPLDEGTFPHDNAVDPTALDEERRLLYVAATRARDRLVITGAGREPSDFYALIEQAIGVQEAQP